MQSVYCHVCIRRAVEIAIKGSATRIDISVLELEDTVCDASKNDTTAEGLDTNIVEAVVPNKVVAKCRARPNKRKKNAGKWDELEKKAAEDDEQTESHSGVDKSGPKAMANGQISFNKPLKVANSKQMNEDEMQAYENTKRVAEEALSQLRPSDAFKIFREYDLRYQSDMKEKQSAQAGPM